MTKLLRQLVEHRIKPYYLHHGDRARGTGHFRTRISTGQKLIARLHGNVSGICQPTYVLDIPGGYGKTPIGPGYIDSGSDGIYDVTDYRGRQHVYNDTGQKSEFGTS
jgi:lysine 2,3-aminomutase